MAKLLDPKLIAFALKHRIKILEQRVAELKARREPGMKVTLSRNEWWRLLGRCFCDHVQYSILSCPCCHVGQEEQAERMPWLSSVYEHTVLGNIEDFREDEGVFR